MAKKKRTGRPKKAEGDKYTKDLRAKAPESLYAQVEQLAKSRCVDNSVIVREAVLEYLQRNGIEDEE